MFGPPPDRSSNRPRMKASAAAHRLSRFAGRGPRAPSRSVRAGSPCRRSTPIRHRRFGRQEAIGEAGGSKSLQAHVSRPCRAPPPAPASGSQYPARRRQRRVAVPELTEFHLAAVSGQEVVEPLVVVRLHVEEGNESAIAATRLLQPTPHEFANVVPRDVARKEQRMDVRPERVVSRRPAPRTGRPLPAAGARACARSPRPRGCAPEGARARSRSLPDCQAACSTMFCSSRTLPGHR